MTACSGLRITGNDPLFWQCSDSYFGFKLVSWIVMLLLYFTVLFVYDSNISYKQLQGNASNMSSKCEQSIRSSGTTYSEGERKLSFFIVCLNWPKRWVPFAAVKVISLFPSGNFEKVLIWQESQKKFSQAIWLGEEVNCHIYILEHVEEIYSTVYSYVSVTQASMKRFCFLISNVKKMSRNIYIVQLSGNGWIHQSQSYRTLIKKSVNVRE